jgi:hypothetical protein
MQRGREGPQGSSSLGAARGLQHSPGKAHSDGRRPSGQPALGAGSHRVDVSFFLQVSLTAREQVVCDVSHSL